MSHLAVFVPPKAALKTLGKDWVCPVKPLP